MNIVRWNILFSGSVQHVGFRYTAMYLAREMNLTGWIRNLADGRVEMEIQGPSSQIRKLIIRIRGRSIIRITNMEIQQKAPVMNEKRFRIRSGCDE